MHQGFSERAEVSLGVFRVVEPNTAVTFAPQSGPGLDPRVASLAEQVVHAPDAGNEQVGEPVASALVEAVALGESCYPSGGGGGRGVRLQASESVRRVGQVPQA